MKSPSHLNKIRFDTKSNVFWSYLLLLLGVAILAIVSYRFFLDLRQSLSIDRNIEAIQNQLALKKPTKDTSDNPEQLDIITKIKNQHHYPWAELFATLESVHSSHISLMAIQPNIEKREILISAEAPDIHQMLSYTRALGLQQIVEHVELQNQETIVENQHEKISFLVMVQLH